MSRAIASLAHLLLFVLAMMTVDDDALAHVHGGRFTWTPALLATIFADTVLFGVPNTRKFVPVYGADPMVALQQAGAASPPLVDVPSAL